MNVLNPNEQRAKTAILLVWAVLGLDIISLISDFFEYNLLQNASMGIEVSYEEANASDLRQGAIGIFYMIAYITSAVTFIMWFRRAYNNLHQKINHLNFSEGWAAGSWFVPFVNLFRPYRIMRELYEETDKLLKKSLDFYSNQVIFSALGLWWILWIISGVLGQFVFRWTMHAETIDDMVIGSIATIIADIVAIPLAFITVKVIKDYSSLETQLYNLKEEVPTDTTDSQID